MIATGLTGWPVRPSKVLDANRRRWLQPVREKTGPPTANSRPICQFRRLAGRLMKNRVTCSTPRASNVDTLRCRISSNRNHVEFNHQAEQSAAMTCKQAIGFLGDYLDGALSWRERLVFHWHLAFCRHCREYLSSYAETVRQTRALSSDADLDTQDVPAELVRAILAARRTGQGPTSGADL